MASSMRRRTMGNDWGGRKAENPGDAPRVTRAQVLGAAAAAGVQVRRESAGWSMWWVLRPGDVWRTLATTNFEAMRQLTKEAETMNASSPVLFFSAKKQTCWTVDNTSLCLVTDADIPPGQCRKNMASDLKNNAITHQLWVKSFQGRTGTNIHGNGWVLHRLRDDKDFDLVAAVEYAGVSDWTEVEI